MTYYVVALAVVNRYPDVRLYFDKHIDLSAVIVQEDVHNDLQDYDRHIRKVLALEAVEDSEPYACWTLMVSYHPAVAHKPVEVVEHIHYTAPLEAFVEVDSLLDWHTLVNVVVVDNVVVVVGVDWGVADPPFEHIAVEVVVGNVNSFV